jgi:hypothetical protein
MPLNFHYLTGVSGPEVCKLAEGELWGRLGVLLQPDTFYMRTHVPHFSKWAFDNACFAGEFREADFLHQLEYIIQEVDNAHIRCQFANAPDVFDATKMRGDPRATIERSLPLFKRIRELGAPAGLVFQDGMEMLGHDEIPWDEFDVAFIGGGDAFKRGYPDKVKAGNPHYVRDYIHGGASSAQVILWARLMHRCHELGKPIHIGRVNGLARMLWALGLGAETCDGTFFSFGPKCIDQMRRWLLNIDYSEGEPHEMHALRQGDHIGAVG